VEAAGIEPGPSALLCRVLSGERPQSLGIDPAGQAQGRIDPAGTDLRCNDCNELARGHVWLDRTGPNRRPTLVPSPPSSQIVPP